MNKPIFVNYSYTVNSGKEMVTIVNRLYYQGFKLLEKRGLLYTYYQHPITGRIAEIYKKHNEGVSV